MTDTSANSVFHTPELLDIICNHCTSNDLTRLIRTSRYAFKVAAPRIWKDLKSVQPLLSLLRLTVVLKEDPVERLDITLPPYTPQAFARFDLYGPLVQTLDVSTGWKVDELKSFSFSLSSWESLGNRSSLLPNLHGLTLSKGYRSDEEILLWLSALVPPGLRAFTILAASGLAQSTVIMALDLLRERCPELKQLGLASSISDSIAPPDLSTQTAIAQMVYSPMTLRRLERFQSLASLQIPGRLINSGSFALIARMPKLESLHIRNDLARNDNLMEVLRSTPLSDDPFPAITKFHISSSHLDVRLNNFRAVSYLPPVTLVKLQYQANRDDAPRGHVIGHASFIAHKISPRSWPMYLGEMPIGWEQPPRITSQDPTWSYVRQLPLAHLTILNSRTDPPFMRETFPVLPLLMGLDMPDQSLTLGHLARLSQIAPRLHSLRSNLADTLDEIPQIQHHTPAPLAVFELFRPLESRLEVASPDKVARFLISIWPSIQGINYKNQSRETQPGLELLNMHIRVAQGVAATKKNITVRFGVDIVSSLLDRRLSSF